MTDDKPKGSQLSIERDGEGKFQKMMSVTHQNPKCIYKEFPLNLFKFVCKYRTSRGRCRKRLLWGDKVQLCADGRCPGYGPKIPKREREESHP